MLFFSSMDRMNLPMTAQDTHPQHRGRDITSALMVPQRLVIGLLLMGPHIKLTTRMVSRWAKPKVKVYHRCLRLERMARLQQR